jgi:starvation-inducible DNA-binding protein
MDNKDSEHKDQCDRLMMCFKLLRNLELLSQQAHWNIKGQDFYPLHLLFERIYNLLHEFVDRYAENMRTMFILVPNSPKFLSDCKMEFPDNPNQTGKKYLELIHAGNRMLAECATECMDMCSNAGKQGIANMLQDLIETAGTIYYLVESQLGLTEQPK